MAGEPDRLRMSADIAEHAGTNPVAVRRVLGRLRKAGVLILEKGHAGGWRLAHPRHSITLADVYLALNEKLILTGDNDGMAKCAIEYELHRQVTGVLEDIEQSLIACFTETTISEIGYAGDGGNQSHINAAGYKTMLRIFYFVAMAQTP